MKKSEDAGGVHIESDFWKVSKQHSRKWHEDEAQQSSILIPPATQTGPVIGCVALCLGPWLTDTMLAQSTHTKE